MPLGACLIVLLGLTAYTAAGAAGAPPARISVTGARVVVPSNPDATAAFFVIRNTGRSPDTLVSVSSPQLRRAVLSRTVVAEGAGHMEPAPGVVVPAGGTVSLIPGGVDVMVPDPPALRVGQQIALDLRFAASGMVRVLAMVVRPGS
ncbi:copper chaperone PCu(A)C [Streptomyces sp. NBC_01198]|uniref:copper chaperone PCu(A)C n=1 Tax=Streptomyces sp. NBC_01198 TaxID=2903769 RepID=UPI002E14570B|nr:copper chaperone PCu(A)C [Streptomyces sp. NBC_01198]